MSLCYKAYMRKWMRERMKRRKKPEETAGSESKPTPLQPAYFDAPEVAAGANDQTPPESEAISAAPPLEQPEEIDGNRADIPSTPADQPRRRRRKRGGRGRSGARRAQSAPTVEAAEAPPIVPPVPPQEKLVSAPKSEPPVTPVVAAQRPPKGVVVLAIGLPGSGKSSWFKRHQITPLSSDLLRALLFDDAQEQRFQDLVFSNLRSMLKARLIARRATNYVDATNLTPHERHSWIKLAKDYGYEVQAVFFDVPVEVCLDRNRRRQRSVDDAVMQRMADKLRPPTFEEGFSKITVVRVKKKEAEAS
jgi:predicted kinase